MKNKRKIISIIAALLCISMIVCATGCSNGLMDKLKDIIGEEAETESGSNYVPDKSFAVSGVWVFNETIDISDCDGRTWNVNHGNNLTTFGWDCFNEYGTHEHNLEDDRANHLYIYDGNTQIGQWDHYEDTSPIIDFGTTPQIISKDFYDWLTANAVKQTYTGNDTTGGESISYKEVLTQDSDEIWIDWIYFGGSTSYFSIFSQSLYPDTKYIVEWCLEDSLSSICEPIYNTSTGKYCMYKHQDFGKDASLGDVVVSFDDFRWNAFETGYVEFTTSPDCGLVSFAFLCCFETDQTYLNKCIDIISDNLLLRISKVE